MEVAPFFVDFHHFLSIFTNFYRFTHFCRDLHFVAIYALFPQILFGQNSLLRNITRFLHVCSQVQIFKHFKRKKIGTKVENVNDWDMGTERYLKFSARRSVHRSTWRHHHRLTKKSGWLTLEWKLFLTTALSYLSHISWGRDKMQNLVSLFLSPAQWNIASFSHFSEMLFLARQKTT